MTTEQTPAQLELSEFIARLMGWRLTTEFGITFYVRNEGEGYAFRDEEDKPLLPPYAVSWALIEELVAWLNERGFKVALTIQTSSCLIEVTWKTTGRDGSLALSDTSAPMAMCRMIRSLVDMYAELAAPVVSKEEGTQSNG